MDYDNCDILYVAHKQAKLYFVVYNQFLLKFIKTIIIYFFINGLIIYIMR